MPRETHLPILGTPPKGHTWSLRRVQGKVGGRFNEAPHGHTYYLNIMKNGRSVHEERFFVESVYDTEKILRTVESKMHKRFS